MFIHYSKIHKVIKRTLPVLLFCLVFLIAGNAKAVEENFDSYSAGNIDSKSADWTYDSGGHLQVYSGQYVSSPNGLRQNSHYSNGGTLYNPSDIDALESVSFKFKFNDASKTYFQLYGQNSGTYDTSIYSEDLWALIIRRGTHNQFNGETFGTTISDNSWHDIEIQASSTPQYFRACVDSVCSSWKGTGLTDEWDSLGFNDDFHNMSYDLSFDDFNSSAPTPPFLITSPVTDEMVINDSWITVTGACATNGSNRVGVTNDCSGFDDIDYNVACVDGTFSTQFFKTESSDWVIAREVDSVSTDCVDYDELMDVVEVDGISLIDGYPEEWSFDYDYYDDYDIQINSPVFDTALTLPLLATSTDISYGFVYPEPLSANLVFNVKQYDENGSLLNGAYHNINLNTMSDTSDYSLNMVASSTSGLHYVVQLINDGVLKRQYPFGIYVSDYEVVVNPNDYDYLFPRLAEELKTKVIFNYFFAFYDNFQELFSASSTASSTALDISFKSVSDNGEYDLDVPIFKPSESIIQTIMQDFRPYLVAFLWVGFAIYLFVRVVQKDDDI
ncbi:hypothetical protein ISS03_04225 [Patescibacteria group bacterium]|nr:hypothetical protein [Patescibacteria group bacterium]